MTTTYAILNSPIPQGGFGRNITSSECKKLRALGVRCSQRYIVIRRVFEISSTGLLYKPAPKRLGGFDSVGIGLTR